MSEPTQKYRFASIETKLGEDRLLLKVMHGVEELGRLFDYNLTLAEPPSGRELDPDDLIGQNVTVRVQLETAELEQARYFNGFIASLSFLGHQQGASLYHARMVPWLWLLSRSSDCRSFPEATVPQILETIFSEHGFAGENYFRFDLRNPYQHRVFCVQYNESALNFVSRLLEHEGMYYWWEHHNGRHVMVITDDASTHQPHPARSKIEWRERSGVLQDGYLYNLKLRKNVSAGKFALSDYNFKTPAAELRSQENREKRHAASTFAHFEYPGYFRDAQEGQRLSRVRLEEAQAGHELIEADVTARAIATGYKFELTRAERSDQVRGYIVTTTQTRIALDDYAASASGSGPRYDCHLTAIPEGTPFRPARLTPKPVVRGPQPAMVVGPPGEEIHCDEHGRVKVHFYWDRRSQGNADSSKWVRVSQVSAGAQYGFMSLPRVGQEVLVEFMNGDPDQPIITGRVYNGDNELPYDPSEHKTRSAWKTSSYPGGGGFNELRFEDLRGKEQIFLHGQKDMDARIRHKRREYTGDSRHEITSRDSLESVGRDKHEQTGRHFFEEVKENHCSTIGGDQLLEVKKAFQLRAVESLRVTTEGNAQIIAAGDLCVLTAGKVVLRGESITLKCGANFVRIDHAGIAISGTTVLINSGGAPETATIVPEKLPLDLPQPPEMAADNPAGKVEKSKGGHHRATAASFPSQTVSDMAAQDGRAFMEEKTPSGFRAAPGALGLAGSLAGLAGVKALLTPVKEGVDELRDLLRQAVREVQDASALLQEAVQTVSGDLRQATAPVKQLADDLRGAVGEVDAVVRDLHAATKAAADLLKDSFKDAATEVTAPLQDAVSAVHDLAIAVKSTAGDVKQLASTARAAVTDPAAAAQETVKSLVQDSVSATRETASAVQESAAAVNGVADGFRNSQEAAGSGLEGAAKSLRQSKDMLAQGGEAMRGATRSIQDELSSVRGAVRGDPI